MLEPAAKRRRTAGSIEADADAMGHYDNDEGPPLLPGERYVNEESYRGVCLGADEHRMYLEQQCGDVTRLLVPTVLVASDKTRKSEVTKSWPEPSTTYILSEGFMRTVLFMEVEVISETISEVVAEGSSSDSRSEKVAVGVCDCCYMEGSNEQHREDDRNVLEKLTGKIPVF